MLERIIEFSKLLRRNGIRVSLPENMDALRALELVGIADPALFRSALRASLIKRSIDTSPFEGLFDLYFLGLGETARRLERSLMQQLGLTPQQFQEMLDQLQRVLDSLDGNISQLTRALLSGNMGEVERLLREAAEEEFEPNRDQVQGAGVAQRIAGRIGLSKIREEIDGFRAMLARLGADAETTERLSEYAEQRLRNLLKLIQELAGREIQTKDLASSERQRLDYLAHKSFAYYTEEDIRRMNDVVAHLAQRFKNLLSLRRRRARRGRLAVSATFRKNLQYGGVPFRIQLDHRRKEKPQVIVLCDVSDSVLNASRFMLQFVYSVQELYSKVRSFIFVNDIGEVTRLFEENEIHQAIDMTLRGDVINVYSHSNFGRAFELFYRNHWAAVTGKTTLLIMGDGRNNYNRANEWVLKEIQQRAKRLIWLNPESRSTWGYGDSEMARYAPYCDVVEECRNIQQLYRVIDRIAA